MRTTFWNAKEEVELEKLPHRVFNQSADLNKHQGGMARAFQEIEDSVINSKAMKTICLALKNGRNLVGGQEIEIHQLRVLTQQDGTAQVAPEGVHQDGYDHIAMVGINRHNITGGELMAYKTLESKDDPFLTYALEAGEMLLLDDAQFYHWGSPITAKSKEEAGYGDWFVLCVKK